MDEKALMIKDEAMLATLGGLARQEDTGGAAQQIPVLKINYDPESKHPRGAWVVGQRKDQNGNIQEEGKQVVGLVILQAKHRWSYYVQGDKRRNCSSKLFNFGETVRGSTYGQVCGRGCSYRKEGTNPRCRAQRVLFGLAVTPEGQMIDCVCYLGGASYMPISEHIDSISHARTKGGYMPIPLFTFLTALKSTKERNAGTVYFVAQFERGQMFAREQWEKFAEKRDAVDRYVDTLNSSLERSAEAVAPAFDEAPPAKIIEAETDSVGEWKAPGVDDDIPFDVTPVSVKLAETGVPVGQKDEPPVSSGGMDFDIEAAIKNALAGSAA